MSNVCFPSHDCISEHFQHQGGGVNQQVASGMGFGMIPGPRRVVDPDSPLSSNQPCCVDRDNGSENMCRSLRPSSLCLDGCVWDVISSNNYVRHHFPNASCRTRAESPAYQIVATCTSPQILHLPLTVMASHSIALTDALATYLTSRFKEEVRNAIHPGSTTVPRSLPDASSDLSPGQSAIPAWLSRDLDYVAMILSQAYLNPSESGSQSFERH